jgi:hypothetical protein
MKKKRKRISGKNLQRRPGGMFKTLVALNFGAMALSQLWVIWG